MPNELRARRLVREAVGQLQLDLRGLVVLTEAATGHYSVTAAIAAVAGADQVFAVARDSVWGTATDAGVATRAMVLACADRDRLTIVEETSPEVLRAADLVTNLGFVRPINAERVSAIKPTAVVSLMCEPWEVRPGDVDLEACARRGIVVLGTNESSREWPVFSYSGPLAARMLFDAGIEVLGSRIAVLGRDKFAPVIARWLRRAGALVKVDRRLSRTTSRAAMRQADAVIVADYSSDQTILGEHGLVKTSDLAELAPHATIVQFAGGVDEPDLRRNGFDVWPTPVVPPRRMSRTFSALGLKPVIELHAAGLRVGEAAARMRLRGVPAVETVEAVCQDLPLALPAQPGTSVPVGS